jgi:hypothetical protein
MASRTGTFRSSFIFSMALESCSSFFCSSAKERVTASSSFLSAALLAFSWSMSPTMVGWEFSRTSTLALMSFALDRLASFWWISYAWEARLAKCCWAWRTLNWGPSIKAAGSRAD